MAYGNEVVILFILFSSFVLTHALVKFYAKFQQFNMKNLQVINMKNLQNRKLTDDDNPSAPPFSDAGGEIKQEQIPVSTRLNGMPSAAAADGFERKTATASLQNNIRQETPKTSARFVFSLKINFERGS